MCDLIVWACAHPTGLASFTIRSMISLRYGKQKITTRFPTSILLAILYKLIKKVNMTVITTLETDWPQEATLREAINSYHWKLDSKCWPNCATVRITLWLCFEFCKMYFRSYFSGVCDLEYYYHFAMFIICLRRKLGWPQSPVTVKDLHV